MLKLLLFCILLVLCWPLALLALILYPFIWLVCLPFRIVGIAVTGFPSSIRPAGRQICCRWPRATSSRCCSFAAWRAGF